MGAEAFWLMADEISWQGGVSEASQRKDGQEDPSASSLELLEHFWPGRVKDVRKEWWADNPRRGFFDTTKTKRLLGWSNEA